MKDPGATLRERLRELTFRLGGPGARERLAKLTSPRNEYGVDPFGFDLDYAVAAMAPFLWLYRRYFRVQVFGIDRVPARGPLLFAANHSGQLPFDAAMLGAALLVELDPPRFPRALVERWVPRLPFVSSFFARVGQVVGTPENCQRLLAAGETLLVFPEGVRGLNKPFQQRYVLQEFGTGFMRLAMEAGVPIVPVGIVGAEEQAPSLVDLRKLARRLAMPALPVTPTPFALPLPTRYRIHFGAPLGFSGPPDEEDALVEERVRAVQSAIAGLLAEGLRRREHVFW